MARSIQIAFRWTRHPGGHPTGHLREFARRALRNLGVDQAEVGVLICDDETIRSLNRHFRGKDRPTDVLSFPSGTPQPEGPPYLGDVAISLETAERQARDRGHSIQRELEYLLLHALLHLSGFDHERDDGEMERLEANLQRELVS